MDKIPDRQARKILAAKKKSDAHRAGEAGTLRQVADCLSTLVKLLADLHVEGDQALENDIQIVLHVLRRFRTRIKSQQQTRTGALHHTLAVLDQAERLLRRAEGPGYGVRRLVAESHRDLTLLKRLRGNLQLRQREAAFVLAELEQAADPLPGLRIVSAAKRKQNDKLRKEAPPISPEASVPSETSKP